jgi:hypothetical protein
MPRGDAIPPLGWIRILKYLGDGLPVVILCPEDGQYKELQEVHRSKGLEKESEGLGDFHVRRFFLC